jgi:hypothetical protein
MLRMILGAVVIAHGLITAAIWTAPARKDAPFDASHSWLLGDVRVISVILGILVGAAFVATGVGLLGNVTWWPTSAVIAGLGGVVLMVVWFNAWLILGLAISAAVLVAGLRGLGTS